MGSVRVAGGIDRSTQSIEPVESIDSDRRSINTEVAACLHLISSLFTSLSRTICVVAAVVDAAARLSKPANRPTSCARRTQLHAVWIERFIDLNGGWISGVASCLRMYRIDRSTRNGGKRKCWDDDILNFTCCRDPTFRSVRSSEDRSAKSVCTYERLDFLFPLVNFYWGGIHGTHR